MNYLIRARHLHRKSRHNDPGRLAVWLVIAQDEEEARAEWADYNRLEPSSTT